MWQTQFRQVLKSYLENTQSKNQSFSLRAFAKKISVSPGGLSEMLNGERRVSLGRAIEILTALPGEGSELLQTLQKIQQTKFNDRVLLPDEAVEMISQWKYFAVLSFLECQDRPRSAYEFATRLGMTETEFEATLEFLSKHGFIIKNDEGVYAPTGISWTTTDGVPSHAGRMAHVDTLRLTEKALHELPIGLRDFTTITFPADRERMDAARQEIRRFKDRLTKIMQGKSNNAVYKLNTQLIPLDQWDRSHEKT